MPNALERSYVTDVDAVMDNTSATTFAKNFLWAMKAALTKDILSANCGAVTAWSVIGSSDSSTAGMDAVDRWLAAFDATKIVLGATNAVNVNSWIVLKHPTASIWLTIQYVGGALNTCTLIVSNTAPTGGTTSARPTATGSMTVLAGYAFIDSSATAGKVHRCFDSESYFILGCSRNGSGRFTSLLAVQKTTENKSGDTSNWALIWDQGSAAAALLCANTTAGSGTGVNQWRGSATVGPCRTYLVNGSATIVVPGFWLGSNATQWFGGTLTAADSADSKYDDIPCYLLGILSGAIGVKGRLYDWRLTAGPGNGDIYPAANPSQTHMCMGNVWIPWTVAPTL